MPVGEKHLGKTEMGLNTSFGVLHFLHSLGNHILNDRLPQQKLYTVTGTTTCR